MSGLRSAIESIAAETGFSGAVRIEAAGEIELAEAYGLADRAHAIPNTVETQFAIASGVKGLTALTVVSLVEEGGIELGTRARTVLGDDLPLIRDDVTVEHLLAHRSGIGDYLDEEVLGDVAEYVLPVPVHRLATTEDYLAVLDGHETKFAPDERFAYCNSGYVVLALIAERTTSVPFHELVRQRVCEPAGMTHTAFLRSDELPGRAAVGYLSATGLRTNVLHLPVRGSGDGGIYTTLADVSAFWRALFESRIVGREWVAEMTRPRSDVPRMKSRYGLGFWLGPAATVFLEGYDAGVSFRSVHDPARRLTWTVVSNTSEGAWPLVRLLADRLSCAP
jgi:CubicO group peptidase (beta-lactamase class C family)